jgi:aminomethyltransferase
MVPFAGFEMPVQYPMGVLKEHLHTREKAGLFDVSHMGQVIIEGPGAQLALERLMPVDLDTLGINQQRYGFFCNEQGGILDDLMIVRWDEERFFLVINAACVAEDIAHMQAHLPSSVSLTHLHDHGLLALQGPQAAQVMAELAHESMALFFMSGGEVHIGDVACFVTRSGYTGEDGFEISVPAEHCEAVARLLLNDHRVAPIGLGARDSLRLESGLCLYGHDLNTTTTPIEANLLWAISPSRRPGGVKQGGYLGAEVIQTQLMSGVSRKRVGLKVLAKAPIREGVTLIDDSGKTIGEVTSGGFSPSLSAPIAMAYVDINHVGIGEQVTAMVRNKPLTLEVCSMPFVAQNYRRA